MSMAPDVASEASAQSAGAAVAGSPNDLVGNHVMTRDMPFDQMVALWNSDGPKYQGYRDAVADRPAVSANGISISGCHDNQLSQEVNGAGVFTTTLNRVWANGGFAGSYEAFHRAVVAQMGPNQTPELGLFGANGQQLLARTPFKRWQGKSAGFENPPIPLVACTNEL